jgi:phthalate 4,5-cis-dihydrodiol dehydrogenase
MAISTLRIGVAGLGRAFQLMLPTLVGHPRIVLAAAADPRAEARDRFAADFSAQTYATVEEMCADPAVQAVYIATPHQFHASNVIAAASNRKHVLVEKPMALRLEECLSMIAATRCADVRMVIGHSHSFDAPIRRTRELIASGAVGSLRMISALNYTDFLYRPRRPEELRTDSGGGVVFNQAPHQVDIVRLLGGGLVRSVYAITGAWDSARPTEGAYGALLKFESGAHAAITYSGYAHFDSDELMDGIAESGHSKSPSDYGAARGLIRHSQSPDQELALKNTRMYGGVMDTSAMSAVSRGRAHQHFGLIVASCDHADLRPTAQGVKIYDDFQERFEALPPPKVPRAEVIDELCDAIFLDRPALHSGEWGMATMEVCLAMLQSSREGREISLKYQIGTDCEAR